MQMLTTREAKRKIANKTITPLELAQYEQYVGIKTEGRKGFKEWLDKLSSHTNMEMGTAEDNSHLDIKTFKGRCTAYINKYIRVGGTCEIKEFEDHFLVVFENGAEAMWSKAGYLAYRNDIRF